MSRKSRRAVTVAAQWPAVRFSVGVHPHAAGKFADNPADAAHGDRCRHRVPAARRAAWAKSVSIITTTSRRVTVQQQVFREQIRLAQAAAPADRHSHARGGGRYVSHSRARSTRDEIGGVFHCFTGDRAMAQRALDIGFHVSLAGIVTFPRAQRAEGSREDGAAGSAADRDRQSVSGAGAASRQAQRTGQRRARGRRRLPTLRGSTSRRSARRRARNFARLFRAGI